MPTFGSIGTSAGDELSHEVRSQFSNPDQWGGSALIVLSGGHHPGAGCQNRQLSLGIVKESGVPHGSDAQRLGRVRLHIVWIHVRSAFMLSDPTRVSTQSCLRPKRSAA
jgi:hypothetical protein